MFMFLTHWKKKGSPCPKEENPKISPLSSISSNSRALSSKILPSIWTLGPCSSWSEDLWTKGAWLSGPTYSKYGVIQAQENHKVSSWLRRGMMGGTQESFGQWKIWNLAGTVLELQISPHSWLRTGQLLFRVRERHIYGLQEHGMCKLVWKILRNWIHSWAWRDLRSVKILQIWLKGTLRDFVFLGTICLYYATWWI